MSLETLEPHWWWLLFAALLALFEIMLPGVFMIWIAVAAALTALLVAVVAVPFAYQLVLFALFALAAVYGGRRWYTSHPVGTSDPLLNDRAARLIGRTVEVVEPIRNGEGRVKAGDSVWVACGEDAELGASVRVVGAEGGTLRVAP